MPEITELENNIGATFKNKDFLQSALTHRSYLNENPAWKFDHNERLEFLGDAVLELIVTENLYATYPNPEGEMTNWRAALVNSVMLAHVATKIKLNDFLLLSRGEAKDMGRARQYILANAVEAVIGALYLDRGYDAARQFVVKFIMDELPAILEGKSYRDSKSRLQEEAQERLGVTPSYTVLEDWGPDHAKNFRVGVTLDDGLAGEGSGPSKQEAQQAAAEDALAKRDW
ncbi:MAG: ribonuclease III [Patescibacteria group bacterium]